MSSQTVGILLFFIVMILSFSTFGLRYVNKKVLGNYFFWAIPAVIFLAYFIDVRYFGDWNDFFKNTSFITGNKLTSYGQSITISKALLLDLCPFLGIFLPLSLIFDKTRKTSYVLAPFCILGGLTVFGSILGGVSPGGDVEFTFQYLFVGHTGNELYFILHSYLIVMGFMLVFQSNVNKLKYLWTYYAFIVGYFLYVYIIVATTKVEYNTSGISIRDWLTREQNLAYDNGFAVNGEYSGVSKVFGGIPYPWIMVFAYFMGWLVITIITMLQVFFGSIKAKSRFWKEYNKLKVFIFRKYYSIKGDQGIDKKISTS
ncbi:MAG: DUF5378 family protein [Mycoplasmoidaceae bacterium]